MNEETMVVAADLRAAAMSARIALEPALATRDWATVAAPTDWSCRDTLDHIANSLCGYAAGLANRSQGRRRHHPRNGDPAASPTDLLDIMDMFAGILTAVADAADPEVHAYHPAGLADRDGFVAMGCDEILIHTHDIASSLDVDYERPVDLVARVRSRLFPWAPAEVDAWDALLWANGRASLAGHPRLPDDWWWHCAPLDEWDGRPRRRTDAEPPGWR